MTTATKYKSYPKYKPSGIDPAGKQASNGAGWLGDIPVDWEAKNVRYQFRLKNGYAFKTDDFVDNGVPVVKMSNLKSGELSFEDGSYIPEELCIKDFEIQKGDLLIGLSGSIENFAEAKEVDIPCQLNQRVGKFVILDGHSKKYLRYFLQSRSYREQIFIMCNGSTIMNVSTLDIEHLKMPVPRPSVQQSIADFLDRETTKIDEMVVKKQKMIDLLKEKRQALITHAVTKGLPAEASAKAGLDPKAKMKPSGIDPAGKQASNGAGWLGGIPVGWEVKKFGFLFSFNKGLSITKENLQDDGIPCVNYGEIHSKYGFEVNPSKNELKCVSNAYLENNQGSVLHFGDFVFADTSEDIKGAGNFTYLNSHEMTFAGYHTVIARSIIQINFRFLAYLFDSVNYRAQIRSSVVGIKVYSITKDILKNSYVLLPPSAEQKFIADFLDQATEKIDQATQKIEQQIEFIKEYRMALISSAVTGKIKVGDNF